MTPSTAILLLVIVSLVSAALFLRDRALRIILLLLVIALAVPTLYFLNYFTLYDLIFGATDKIAQALGVSSKLSTAGATLLVVPASIVIGLLASASRFHRRLGQSILAIGVASYWIVLWVATKDQLISTDGQDVKCYTISEEGVTIFEREQVDPKTGEWCRKVDVADIPSILAIDKKIRSIVPTKPLQYVRVSDIHFFDVGTYGPRPVIWYYRPSAGLCEFYDTPGYHPLLGIKLGAITSEAVSQCLEREEIQRQQSEKDQQAKKQEQEQMRRDHLRTLVNGTTDNPYRLGVTIVPERLGDLLDEQATGELINSMKKRLGGGILIPMYAPAFQREGYFDAMLNGDSSVLVDSNSHKVARKIALGKATARCQESSLESRLLSCSLTLHLGIFGVEPMTVITLSGTGAGFNEQLAIGRAAETLLEQNGTVFQ